MGDEGAGALATRHAIPGSVLIPPAVMARIDAATIAGGIPGTTLMLNAGRAVTRAITARFPPQAALVACGPGNNGGDGYVVARLLHDIGWPVRVLSLGDPNTLKGDAAWARAFWSGPIERLSEDPLAGETLVIDALFGAGLARPLEGIVAAAVRAFNAAPVVRVAVDIPSGIDGVDGRVRGAAGCGEAARADLTVTFCRAKPGHHLLPGRLHVGELIVADIGIPDAVVRAHDVGLRLNGPELWRHALPRRTATAHKYTFGHALIVGGPAAGTGAARLAAIAALRAGAGLVSVACEPEAIGAYAPTLTTVMTKPFRDLAGLAELLADRRIAAALIGPGRGVSPWTRAAVRTVLASGKPAVLDADALSAFAGAPDELLSALHPGVVLTPHDGEFARLFRHTGDRLGRARAAAAESGAVIVLKGGDTVIAAPDGRAAINADAPPTLATAGTGDVLAGLIAGLLAQGVGAWEAAAAGVGLHGAAARAIGGPLIAEDLPAQLPAVLRALGSGTEALPAGALAEPRASRS